MRYTVVWVRSAENRLADIWNQASDRQAVADASNRIDRFLRTDPERMGVFLRGKWILVQRPLAVTYTVSPDDRLVRVLQVRRIRS